jgi:hypothetical protein
MKIMPKKIILTLFILLFSFLSLNSVIAFSIPVENVFSDIDADYKYLNELQTLYDKGMISPDIEWKFNPRTLLTRDEFVWILMEITCKKCIQPNTVFDLINKYENKSIFYDINKTNKYFYCIASASDEWFVSGYHPWTACEDWTNKDLEKPFCPNNTIILEEAIAVILRASWILTNEEAEKIRIDIFNGKITEALSTDVTPKNLDWSVYSFYPDFQKALDYEVVEVDKNWNIITYNLVDIIDWKIRPKQAISKEIFLRIAYVALKANSCVEKVENNIALKINVFDKSCNVNDLECSFSDLNDPSNIYDFKWDVYLTCEQWISDPEWYIWRFYNHDTWIEFKKYWKYIDNYEFLSEGKWEIFFIAIDKCWNTWEVHNIININNNDTNKDLSVSIKAEPIYWNLPLLVNYEWIVSWGKWPYIYSWNFWDWNMWYWKDIKNIFKIKWNYETILEVTDANWDKAIVTVIIQVINNTNNEKNDTDGDWVIDIDDFCPLIFGDIKNNWCPNLEQECDKNWNCSDWYTCSKNNICLPEILSNSCEYSGSDVIFWNVICNSCPCSNSFDFISTIRKCDVIFPAITSVDDKIIFSKWQLFQIK